VVKAPGTLVVTCYCTTPDVRLTVTPDLKVPETDPKNGGVLLYVDLGYVKSLPVTRNP
jgi:phosphoribosylformylglycinamidine synthase